MSFVIGSAIVLVSVGLVRTVELVLHDGLHRVPTIASR